MVIVKVQVLMACVAGAKRGGGGRREEGEKNERGEGRGAPAIRAGVFVFNCQYMTNHK